jgi:hypothetical protein
MSISDRLSQGGDGDLYVLSKSYGVIRKMVSVVTPPALKTSASRLRLVFVATRNWTL